MRIKVVMFGSDPVSLMADAQLLRERGLLVISAFNMQTVNELVNEVKPDVVFFDPSEPNNLVTDAYNAFKQHSHIPVIFTLAEDDMYLVTRPRNERALVADNIVDAVHMALEAEPIRITKPVVRVRSGSAPVVRAMQLFS
jgi:response regulator RpfG family c-di-GMP phosphodiesterase